MRAVAKLRLSLTAYGRGEAENHTPKVKYPATSTSASPRLAFTLKLADSNFPGAQEQKGLSM